MNIDRLLIICSVIELSFIAICDGPECFTAFQWAALGLLLFKAWLVLAICNKPIVAGYVAMKSDECNPSTDAEGHASETIDS